MFKRFVSLLLFMLIALPAIAEPNIISPDKVEPYKVVWAIADGVPKDAVVLWDVLPIGKQDFATPVNESKFGFVAAPGTYLIELVVFETVGGKLKPNRIRKSVTISGKVDPEPEPEPGPGPGPSPDPDNPPPIPDAGFRVVISYDSGVDLSPAQKSILYSKDVRDYLEKTCVLGPDGKLKAYRIWPATTDLQFADPMWQKVMARKRESLPWIVISNGKTGYEGPLPADIKTTMELLKKYEK